MGLRERRIKYARRPKRTANAAAATPIPAVAPELIFEDEGDEEEEDVGVVVDAVEDPIINEAPEEEDAIADEDEVLEGEADDMEKVE